MALASRIAELEEALGEHRRTSSELAQALAAGRVSPSVGIPDPRTVVEATTSARRDAQNLKLAPRAFKTAAESPFRPAVEIYRQLLLLDQLAGEYLNGKLGMALGERATQLGLT